MNTPPKPDRRADQFHGTQCEGMVSIFWNPAGLVGWFWQPIGAKTGFGPFPTSRLALLAAIQAGHVQFFDGRTADTQQEKVI